MLIIVAVAAAFVLGDRYEPAGAVAWLCPTPEAAAEVGLKTDRGASPAMVSALARARKCQSWENGALNVREVRRVGAQDVGLIRVDFGAGPEVSNWVARNTLRWSGPGAGKATKR